MKSKILIIEDDASLVNNLGSLLEEEGYQVIHASNGLKGLTKALKEKPDLIISDIMMPGLDGFEVKKALDKNDTTFDIPLIFLTARTEMEDLRYGMQLGADDYLFKPYKASDLLKVIVLRINKKKRTFAKLIKQKSTEASIDGKLRDDDSIFLQLGNKSKFIKINSITCIRANSQYTNLYLSDGKILLIRKSVKYWESILPSNIFKRIHRSTIVNIVYVTRIEKISDSSHKVYLKGIYEPLALSRRYSSKIKNYFK